MRRFILATAVVATTVTGGGVAWAASGGVDRAAVVNAGAETTTTVAPGSAATPKPGDTDRSDKPGRWGEARDARLRTVLDGLVSKGTITRAQADAILSAWQAQAPKAHDLVGPGRGFGLLREGMDTVAATIGVTPEELRTELQGGKSLAEVAKAHGVEPAAVTDALVQLADRELDQAVADGKLTAEQAQKMRDRVGDLVARFVDHAGGGGPHGRPPRSGN
jgi:polyhydroxyalkanoate synthesis regulator phasin